MHKLVSGTKSMCDTNTNHILCLCCTNTKIVLGMLQYGTRLIFGGAEHDGDVRIDWGGQYGGVISISSVLEMGSL